jgi:hypothetical protein
LVASSYEGTTHNRLSDYINEHTGEQKIDQWDLIAPHASVDLSQMNKNDEASSIHAATLQWHQIIADNNRLIDQYYHPHQPSTSKDAESNGWFSFMSPSHVHNYAGHECHFFQTRILNVG